MTRWLADQGVVFEASRVHVELWQKLFPSDPIEDADGTLQKLNMVATPVVAHERLLTPSLPEAAHTKHGVDIALSRPVFGFFHDMGTRKTALMIAIAGELWARSRITQALIVTSKRGTPQLLNEQLPLHAPLELRYRAGEIVKPGTARKFQYPKGDLLIGVASYGALQSAAQSDKLVAFCKAAPTAVFLDESQNIKGWSSRRVSNLLKLRPFADYRYLFSGEPQPNGYIDLYAQFYFLDPNILGHNSLTSFRNNFCVFGGYEFKKIVAYKNVEELAELIAPYCEYLNIDDCMDMPERQMLEARFKPTDEQQEIYDDMKHDFVAEVMKAQESKDRDPEIVRRACKNAASKFMALQQIANGWLAANPLDDGSPGPIAVINDERAYYTVEEQVGSAKKCIVWARFHQDLASLRRVFDELKIDAVEFSGRISDKQNEANKLRFQSDPNCRVFFGTAASGGTSLNLQVAHRMVYFSNSFNYNDRAQSERRIWRSGQRHACQYVDVMGFPIDRHIRNNLFAKEDLSLTLRTVAGLASLVDKV